MLKTKSPSNKQKIKKILNFKVVFIVLLIVCTLGNVLFTVRYTNEISESTSVNNFSMVIADGLEGINQPMFVDPKEKMQYLPEMNLSFPYSSSAKLLYNSSANLDFAEQSTEIPDYSTITTTQLLDSGINTVINGPTSTDSLFLVLPAAQKCSRAFMIFDSKDLAYFKENMLNVDVNDSEQNLVAVGNFVTSDGRNMAVYREKDLCVEDTNQMVEDAMSTILAGQSY